MSSSGLGQKVGGYLYTACVRRGAGMGRGVGGVGGEKGEEDTHPAAFEGISMDSKCTL